MSPRTIDPYARRPVTRRPWRVVGVVVATALAASLAPEATALESPPAAATSSRGAPEHGLAGGCYTVRSAASGRYVARAGEEFAVTAVGRRGAEPFRFQATDLGSYLLYGSAGDFLAAREGAAGEATGAVTGSTAGGIAGGASAGLTDEAGEVVAKDAAGALTGRGSGIVAAATASELADWEVRRSGRRAFVLYLRELDRVLIAGEGGELLLEYPARARKGAGFAFESARGCARFPEIQVNVSGTPVRGDTPFEEVRGFLDGHGHPMAFEFIGGRIRCGRPWHRFGAAHALVDCPDHEPGGRGAVAEALLSGTDPLAGHDTTGWPTFRYWPRHDSLTHEQVYWKWMERAWRAGLRMHVALLVDNAALCDVYPYRKNSCNEMDGVRLQARRLRELERYIDAQNGGPGRGWLRIVTNPFQARRVINEGKLAVVQGIEVSSPLDCRLILDVPQCDREQIDRELEEVYRLGVRQMELTNKFDNALTGVTGDAANNGIVVNVGNLEQTGRFWQMETCTEEDGHSHDKSQHNVHDNTGDPLTERDAIFGAALQVTGTSGVAPVYPPSPHCNIRGLTALGRHAARGMMAKGMMIDPDHMSARARRQLLDQLERADYSGVISSHSWADDTIYPRIWRLGGVATPHAGSSTGFVEKWRKNRKWADPRFLFGLGFGADTNGFSRQGAPRGADAPNKVTYPFRGLGGVTIHQQRSGQRMYDVNVDGVAHYGLYPDWIEDLRKLAGDRIVADMARGPEAYLQAWERAVGIAPNACRADVRDLTDRQLRTLRRGMTPVQVLRALGQPGARMDQAFRYCVSGGRRANVAFSPAGRLQTVTRT